MSSATSPLPQRFAWRLGPDPDHHFNIEGSSEGSILPVRRGDRRTTALQDSDRRRWVDSAWPLGGSHWRKAAAGPRGS